MKMNLPNKLTLARILLIPVFTAIFFIDKIPYNHVISAAIFAIAAFTDFLDGYIARKYNLVTNLGKFLDPIADKALVSTALIILITNPFAMGSSVLGMSPQVAVMIFSICVAIIMIRELMISAFRMIAAKNSIVLAADKVGKAKTFATDVAILFLLVAIDLFSLATLYKVVIYVGMAIFVVATLLTVISGVNYIVKNKQVLSDND